MGVKIRLAILLYELFLTLGVVLRLERLNVNVVCRKSRRERTSSKNSQ